MGRTACRRAVIWTVAAASTSLLVGQLYLSALSQIVRKDVCGWLNNVQVESIWSVRLGERTEAELEELRGACLGRCRCRDGGSVGREGIWERTIIVDGGAGDILLLRVSRRLLERDPVVLGYRRLDYSRRNLR